GEIATICAKHDGGCQRRIVYLLWMGDTITIGIAGKAPPRFRDKLQGPHSAIELGIAIHFAIVRVFYQSKARITVQLRTKNGRLDESVLVDCCAVEDTAGVGSVTGFHKTDSGESVPRKMAVWIRFVGDNLGIPVCAERGRGEAKVLGQRICPETQLI
ncbi:MAG: hypothetical protein E7B29_22610, partial [Mixta calida]|nr:hypothetical protein [Mixta calida]